MPIQKNTNQELTATAIEKEGGQESRNPLSKLVAAFRRNGQDQRTVSVCAPTPLYTPEEIEELMAIRKTDLNERDAADGRTLGYVRIPEADAAPMRQETQLGDVDELFIDVTSTLKTALPSLNTLLLKAGWGDMVKAASLDRLGISLEESIQTVTLLVSRGAEVHLVAEGLVFGPPSEFDDDAVKRSWALLQSIGAAEATLRDEHVWRPDAFQNQFWLGTGGSDADAPNLSVEDLIEAERQIAARIPWGRVASAFKVAPSELYAASHRLGLYENHPR
ncbi:recombinase family protein [Leucobacter aridicollis]|uniref:recombinase family protein n=1 Tax=Leucobacter aridicollis TaxID=283878 RepID=UPI002168D347|nr:recombinase family protein [Leucobacter aridicollis]MCS3429036.1 hypothetical protein [Leucobacter aridicollis]